MPSTLQFYSPADGYLKSSWPAVVNLIYLMMYLKNENPTSYLE